MKLPIKYSKATRGERRLVRQEYITQQSNKCWYCKSSLSEPVPDKVAKWQIHLKNFPKGFLDNPVHLHHDHNTDLTIGAVHAYCNAVLFEYYGQ